MRRACVAVFLAAGCASSSPSSLESAESFWCAEHPESESEEWEDAVPEPGRRAGPLLYRLPFDEAAPRLLAQGSGEAELERQDVSTLGLGAGGLRARSRAVGGSSHRGAGRHAYDFAMPVGTLVLAARAGVVDCAGTEGLTVLHADGTRGLYGHLSRIDVKPGQRVWEKMRLGASGARGVGVPHLHFGVLRREGGSATTSVPIRFADGSDRGVVPRAGEYYGSGESAP